MPQFNFHLLSPPARNSSSCSFKETSYGFRRRIKSGADRIDAIFNSFLIQSLALFTGSEFKPFETIHPTANPVAAPTTVPKTGIGIAVPIAAPNLAHHVATAISPKPKAKSTVASATYFETRSFHFLFLHKVSC